MSTFRKANKTCVVCGALAEATELMSTNAFGAPDLDMRPPETLRSTLFTQIQRCPVCGYCASDLSSPTAVSRDELLTKSYLECDYLFFANELSKSFYRAALLYRAHGDTKNAYACFRSAAWCEDDAMSADSAEACREAAIEQLERCIEAEEDEQNKINLQLIMADMLRRCGRFDELIARFGKLRLEDEVSMKILRFQLKSAKRKDRQVHRADEAIAD